MFMGMHGYKDARGIMARQHTDFLAVVQEGKKGRKGKEGNIRSLAINIGMQNTILGDQGILVKTNYQNKNPAKARHSGTHL